MHTLDHPLPDLEGAKPPAALAKGESSQTPTSLVPRRILSLQATHLAAVVGLGSDLIRTVRMRHMRYAKSHWDLKLVVPPRPPQRPFQESVGDVFLIQLIGWDLKFVTGKVVQ